MRVDLSKDPNFGKIESPIKQLKDKQLEKQKQLRIKRMNPGLSTNKISLDIEIYDPLPQELKTYREDTQIKKLADISKASKSLKKYIIEQERNLKYLRLQRIEDEERGSHQSQLQGSNFRFQEEQRNDSRGVTRQINIPKISELFKNQQKQYVLYESRVMKNKLTNAINSIQNSVNKIKNKSFVQTLPPSFRQSKRGSSQDFAFSKLNKTLSQLSNGNEEDLQLNQLIQKKLEKSQKLRKMLYEEKKMMLSDQISSGDKKNKTGFFFTYKQKPKKKVRLEGIKQVPVLHQEKTINVTPASSLLFQLNNLYRGRQKKEQQLSGLLKNSFQNRQDILTQKSMFYESKTPFNNLSPSSQFKLRKQMNKRLDQRLILSREQVDSFVKFITQIKEEYHVILNSTILQVLEQIRQALINGKVMKKADFTQILESKNRDQLVGSLNQDIIAKLYYMMV